MLRGAPWGTSPCCHHPLARHRLPSCVCAVLRSWVTLPARDYSLDYLEFRLWIGLWVAFFGLVLVATEASHLVQYFTRFTEEGFCALISLIFIYDSLKKMLSLAEAFPINWHYRTDDVTLYSCSCNLSSPGEPRLPWPRSWGCTCTGTSRLVAQPQPGSLNVFCCGLVSTSLSQSRNKGGDESGHSTSQAPQSTALPCPGGRFGPRERCGPQGR